MIDLTPLYDNSDVLSLKTVLILAVILIFALLAFYLIIKFLNQHTRLKIKPIIFNLLFIVLYLLFVFNVYPINQDKYNPEEIREIITENVKGKYGLNILDNTINIYDLEDNIPSSKHYATLDNDNRIYEVYFVKNGDYLNIYTRNEKGVYLPMTTMLNKNTSQNLENQYFEESNSVENSSVGDILE